MLTFLPLEQIDEMDKWEGSQLNTAKEILAFELTKMVHGEEEAQKAQNAARSIFSAAGDSENMPSFTMDASDLTDGAADILTILQKSGLCPSRSEARRAVEQGGVVVDGEKIGDIRFTVSEAKLKNGIVVRRGKKAFKKVLL